MEVILNERQAANVDMQPGDVVYIKAFDVDAYGGIGQAELTADINEAFTWPDAESLFNDYRRQSTVRPLRGDGKPNRPLSAYTVAIVQLPD